MQRGMLLIIIGFSAAFLSLIVLLVGWMHQQEAASALRTQTTTDATVTALSSQAGWVSYRNPTANNSTDVVVVHFTDEKGASQEVAISQYVGSGEMGSLHIGDSVPIVYQPANPSDAHLKVSLVRLAKPTTLIAGVIFLVAFLALGILGLSKQRAALSAYPPTAVPHE